MRVAQRKCADGNEPAHFDGPRAVDRRAVAQLAGSVHPPRDQHSIGAYRSGEIRPRLDGNRLQACDQLGPGLETCRTRAELTERPASPGIDLAGPKQGERVRPAGGDSYHNIEIDSHGRDSIRARAVAELAVRVAAPRK